MPQAVRPHVLSFSVRSLIYQICAVLLSRFVTHGPAHADFSFTARLSLTVMSHDVRVHVISTDALPEDSRITGPMIVVHIVDSSTGRYITRTANPGVRFHLAAERGICRRRDDKKHASDYPGMRYIVEHHMLLRTAQPATFFLLLSRCLVLWK